MYSTGDNVEYSGMLNPDSGSLDLGILGFGGCEFDICPICVEDPDNSEEHFFDSGDADDDDCISVIDLEMDTMRAEALAEWENDEMSLNAVGIKGLRTPTQKQRVAPEPVMVEKESQAYTEFTTDESIGG